MNERVRLDRHDAVGVVTIDNPPVNALGEETIAGLAAVLDTLEGDDRFRVVVLTGAGERAFVAGADIAEFPALLASEDAMRERTRWTRGVFDRIAALPQPVIGAIQAHAVGGGLEVALLCDVLVADERAKFGVTEVKLGLIPGGGGTQRLPRRIGELRAKGMLYFGETIDAATAERWGLVSRVVPHGQALVEAMTMATILAGLPGVAVRAAKRAVDRGAELALPEALDLERDQFLVTFASQDLREGYQAFLDKRAPRFSHQ